jgi:hypothetical protein
VSRDTFLDFFWRTRSYVAHGMRCVTFLADTKSNKIALKPLFYNTCKFCTKQIKNIYPTLLQPYPHGNSMVWDEGTMSSCPEGVEYCCMITIVFCSCYTKQFYSYVKCRLNLPLLVLGKITKLNKIGSSFAVKMMLLVFSGVIEHTARQVSLLIGHDIQYCTTPSLACHRDTNNDTARIVSSSQHGFLFEHLHPNVEMNQTMILFLLFFLHVLQQCTRRPWHPRKLPFRVKASFHLAL